MNSDHREAESARKGGLSPASPQDRDLRTDASDDRFDIGHHLCHIEPKYAIPRAYQGPIAPLIEPLACTVVEPIERCPHPLAFVERASPKLVLTSARHGFDGMPPPGACSARVGRHH